MSDIPKSRFSRFRKMASLSASLAADAVTKSAKKLAGVDPTELSKGTADKLVAALGEMKGLAMKVGQAASMNTEFFPPEARAILSKLQNEAPAMPFSTVEKVIREEFGEGPETLFQSFDQKPMASASLGQVHRAVTKEGVEVAVKIQYPEIADALTADLDNVGMLMKSFPGSSLVDARKYYDEIRDQLMAELDYPREAKLAREFLQALSPWPDLTSPEPIEALTRRRVLTLTMVKGDVLRHFLQKETPPEVRFKVATQLVRATFGPFLKEGLMHQDPHPGNFVVMDDGRLGILDFGAVKRFSDTFLRVNREMFRKAVNRDTVIDIPGLSREVNFNISVDDKEVDAMVNEALDIACRPMREASYDFNTDDTFERLRSHFRKNVTRFIRFRPPPESPLFFRTLAGMHMNMRALKTSGPFRDTFVELLRFTETAR